MAKAAKVVCDRCENKLVAGVSFCVRCGGPTKWASHEERVSWELTQWKTADRTHAADAQPHTGSSRRWIPRPFGRKSAPQPALTLVSAKPQPRIEAPPKASPVATAGTAEVPPATPKPAPAMVKVGPAPAPPKPAPARAAMKPIARPQPVRPASKIEPGPRDLEPVSDTPATVMAMRLLNARVAELDEKVQRLERALEAKEDSRFPTLAK